MTLTLAYLVIAGLAVARITALITLDDLLEPVRHRVFQWSPPYDDLETSRLYQQGRDPGFLGRLIGCYHCVGVWVAALVYAAAVTVPDVAYPVLAVAAIAQISDTTIKASR